MASLSFTTLKFEINFASTSSPTESPSPAPTVTTPAPAGDRRHRRCGPGAVARSKARAAAHQASLAMPPPPPPPPPTASTQRPIKIVPRKPGSRLSFCQLDGEGGGEVECEEDRKSPPSPPPSSPPCVLYCNTAKDHCANCGMCIGLCPDQSGCNAIVLL